MELQEEHNDIAYSMVCMTSRSSTMETFTDTQVVVLETASLEEEEEEGEGEGKDSPHKTPSQRRDCCRGLRAEFQWKKLNLCHPRKDLFCSSQWQWPPFLFVAYRIFFAVYLFAWFVYSTIISAIATSENPHLHAWPAWLSNWNFLILTVHMLLACFNTLSNTSIRRQCCRPSTTPAESSNSHDNRQQSSETILSESSDGTTTQTSSELDIGFDSLQNALPWYIKLDWLLFSITSVVSFIVSITYLTFLLPYLEFLPYIQPLAIDMHLHVINSIVVLLELGITGIPVRLLHAVYPSAFGWLYILGTIIYWAVDNRNVLYLDLLDWNKPVMPIIVSCMLTLIVSPALQIVFFGIYKLRLYLHKRINSSQR